MKPYLVVFDVDSTLIQDEVIELLAEEAGQREKVAEITSRAMAGELDFAASLIERVSTLQGLPESIFQKVLTRITITDGVPDVISSIHENGGKVAAVSGGFTQILEPLAEMLELDFHRANTLEVQDGYLTGKVSGPIIDRQAKADALMEWMHATSLDEAVAVGDGANDLLMMAAAQISVAFNAKQIVKDAADYSIDNRSMLPLLQILN